METPDEKIEVLVQREIDASSVKRKRGIQLIEDTDLNLFLLDDTNSLSFTLGLLFYNSNHGYSEKFLDSNWTSLDTDDIHNNWEISLHKVVEIYLSHDEARMSEFLMESLLDRLLGTYKVSALIDRLPDELIVTIKLGRLGREVHEFKFNCDLSKLANYVTVDY